MITTIQEVNLHRIDKTEPPVDWSTDFESITFNDNSNSRKNKAGFFFFSDSHARTYYIGIPMFTSNLITFEF
jgi:hypothetical protein